MSDLNSSTSFPNGSNELIKLYKRRWIVLAIYCLYAILNASQWLEFAVIADLTKQHYNVSSIAVVWSGTVYMALYVPMLLPAAYVVDNFGLRTAALIGGLGTAIATLIKLFAIKPGSFWLILCAQTILALCRSFITSLPPRIATVWFGPREVSTASGIGIFAAHVGTAINFLMPSFVLLNGDDIGKNFEKLFWIYNCLAIVVAFGVVFMFPAQPNLPPSLLQLHERHLGLQQFNLLKYLKAFGDVFRKKGLIFQLISFSLYNAFIVAVAVLMNELYEPYMHNSKDVGLIGLTGEISVIVGAITIAPLLDKTHWFKGACIMLHILALLAYIIHFIFLYFQMKTLMFTAAVVWGYCNGAYFTAGIEMAVELTYPSSQMATAGVLIASGQLVGMLLTTVCGAIIEQYGNNFGFGFLLVPTIVGAIVAMFTPSIKNRQLAFRYHESTDEMENTQGI